MQFYLDRYRTGDPLIEQAHPSVANRPDGLPEEVDVLIVGCGPAGLVLAGQLAPLPEITTAIVDRRDGKEPPTLPDGSTRTFLEDGDVVSISATAPGPGRGRINLGEVTGTVHPAR